MFGFEAGNIGEMTVAELQILTKRFGDMKFAVDQASMVSAADRQGTIVYINDNFCEISGYKKDDLLGQSYRMVNSGYHPKAFFQNLWETIIAGRVWKGLVRNRAKNGSFFWVETTIIPCLGGNGKPEHYLAIHFDVTERKRQEESLQLFFKAVENTADTIFITGRDGSIEYVNPAFEVTTGYSREEALGKTPRLLKAGTLDPNYYKTLWKTIQAGEIFQMTSINRKKSGELFHAEQTITPIKDSEGRVVQFVSILKDLTERIKKQERDIEMHYASLVQKKLYPQEFPLIPGLDIAGAVIPAEATSGDYLDYTYQPGQAFHLVIGDVSGHGLGPALIMAETRAYLRSLTKESYFSPDEILGSINQSLWEDLEDERFVTLLLVQIDIASRSLRYANAGHTPGYLIDRTGAVKAVLESTGTPLGMFPKGKWNCSERLSFEPGEMVLLLTDGVTESESPDGQWFEAENALAVLRDHYQEPAAQIVRHIRQSVLDFAQGAHQQDDITLAVCKAVPVSFAEYSI